MDDDPLEHERLALERDRAALERDKLELERLQAEMAPEHRAWVRRGIWLPPVVAALAAVVAVAGTWLVALWQLGPDQEAAKNRARDELRLAAVSVVLGAPTCIAAEGRALLAKAVLGDVLPPTFVREVKNARVASFPVLFSFPRIRSLPIGPGFARSLPFGDSETRNAFEEALAKKRREKAPVRKRALNAFAVDFGELEARQAKAIKKAQSARDLLCSELGG